jgi:hypothetical protein
MVTIYFRFSIDRLYTGKLILEEHIPNGFLVFFIDNCYNRAVFVYETLKMYCCEAEGR